MYGHVYILLYLFRTIVSHCMCTLSMKQFAETVKVKVSHYLKRLCNTTIQRETFNQCQVISSAWILVSR